MSKASGPRIAIRYCTQCQWLLRVRDHLDPDRDLGHLDRLPIDQGDRTP
jgi:predicted Rdx family selenoprotein